MNEEIELTSYQWMEKLLKKLGVLYMVRSFDGWDCRNFSVDYYETKIRKEIFVDKLMKSTLIGSPSELMKCIEEL